MHAVLTEVDTSAQPDPQLGLKALQEQIVPNARKTPGFQAGYWLRPLADGKGTSLAIYDTRRTPRPPQRDSALEAAPCRRLPWCVVRFGRSPRRPERTASLTMRRLWPSGGRSRGTRRTVDCQPPGVPAQQRAAGRPRGARPAGRGGRRGA